MAELSAMGRFRGGGARVSAIAVLVGVALGATAAPAAAAGTAGAPAPTTSTTSTSLPTLPKVDSTYTDGQPAQSLLDTAVALASLGVDHSALDAALSSTQARLDADAIAARKARSAADAAVGREAVAKTQLQQAQGDFATMAGAVRQAVIFLYTNGPASLAVSPSAGPAALFAQDYAESTVGPYGVLARRQALEHQRAQALQDVQKATRAAASASTEASKALADQQLQLERLKGELASASSASAVAVTADQVTLAGQAGKELLSDSALQFTPKAPVPPPVTTTSVALTWAFAQLGKEYVWGATGPDTFDCSGLTQFAWKAAGVSIPRVAADQDAWTIPVPLSQLLPGDLVFFGTTDIHHVGIYIGDGLMINAPHTGTVVQVSPIWWSDLAGFGRVHSAGTPVPPHSVPTATQPVAKTVVGTAGPVPSQTKPDGKPSPGSSAPTSGATGAGAGQSTSTTSSSTTSTTTAPTDTTAVDPTAPPGDVTAPVPGSDPSTLPTTTTTTTDPSIPTGGVPLAVAAG